MPQARAANELMDPLVSIIIPAYNSGPWIADTVRSAIAQSWPKKEIVIVDDGSTDDTLSIARSFESRNIRVVKQAHSGACRARNRGIEECQGDFIQWLDADDLLAPNKIAAQLKKCDDREGHTTILFSGAWGKFYYRPQKATFIPTCLWTSLEPLEWMIKRLENRGYDASRRMACQPPADRTRRAVGMSGFSAIRMANIFRGSYWRAASLILWPMPVATTGW